MPGIENVDITKLDSSEVSSNNSQWYGTQPYQYEITLKCIYVLLCYPGTPDFIEINLVQTHLLIHFSLINPISYSRKLTQLLKQVLQIPSSKWQAPHTVTARPSHKCCLGCGLSRQADESAMRAPTKATGCLYREELSYPERGLASAPATGRRPLGS